MILELDCGNSLIKWRLIDAAGLRQGGGVVEGPQALVQALQAGRYQPAVCRLVSVRSVDETAVLVDLLSATFAITVHVAQAAQALAGVSNGYDEYQRLGLDRWLALVAGYQLAGGACLVMDFGTAVTSDFVDASGHHLGGFICPGLALMRSPLRTHTRRIRYDERSAEQALSTLLPGRATVEAVERGCALMLQGFAVGQVRLAEEYFPGPFTVYLTGGDAGRVSAALPGARVVPDLVFNGLALSCPLP